MRFLSLLLFMCFAMNSFASPYVNNAAQLEKIFDDYSFSLNVEWDQEDDQFYQQKTQDFLKSLENLILNEGMNKKDFENFIILKIKKPLIVKQIQTRLTFLPEEASPQELAQAFKDIAKEFSSDFYSQGANWNGGVIISTTLALVIVAVLGYATWFSSGHTCTSSSVQSQCGMYYNCFGMPMGSGMCIEEYKCFDTPVCTEYAKN